MNWNATFRRLPLLIGKPLNSISGRADITFEHIDSESYIVRGNKRSKRRKTEGLRNIVSRMALNRPLHVDSAVFGGGSSRSHPETILANLPDVEWVRINGKKHIVWVGKDTHELGTLKELKQTNPKLTGES